MIKLTKTRIETCCPEMFDGFIRGVFIIKKIDDHKRSVEFAVSLGLFYTDLRFCSYCGEETTVSFSEGE